MEGKERRRENYFRKSAMSSKRRNCRNKVNPCRNFTINSFYAAVVENLKQKHILFLMLQLLIKQVALELTLKTSPRRKNRKTEGRQKLREHKEWQGRNKNRKRLEGNWRSVGLKSYSSSMSSMFQSKVGRKKSFK